MTTTSRAGRRRRGTADATRARLVATGAEVFNRDGYHGTDSNRLARAAGYAPATFYKHFPDKRALFLAVYEAWVTAEWAAVERVVRSAASPQGRAARIVAMVVALHRRWRGLRAGLRVLVATDATARAFYRAQRRRQLRMLAAFRGSASRRGHGARAAETSRTSEDDAILLFTLERVADAIAEGELHDLGVAVEPTLARLRALVLQHLSPKEGGGSPRRRH